MRTYKDYPILPTTATVNNADNNVAKARGARISSLWGNAIATDLYLVSSVLFLLGAIFWVCRENNYNINGYTAGKFENAASILWIVGSSIIFFAALAHCVARR
jgi:heme/copper-type cytochrome/quinol oxidase subunit 2